MSRFAAGGAALAALVAVAAAPAFRGDPPPPSDFGPIWSPDASAIVYTRVGPPGNGGLRVMSAVGEGDRPLPIPNSAVFSPDWRWVAFTDFSRTSTIFVSTPEGGSRRPLVEGTGPSWAPSSDRLAFEPPRNQGEPPTIEAIDLDGSNRLVIAHVASGARWSPDGTRVAFYDLTDSSRPSIGVADVDGGNRTSVYGPAEEGRGFAWSPDGTTIAVVTAAPYSRELGFNRGSTLALVRLRDRRVRTFRLPLVTSSPSWSPDGKYIALDGLLRFDVDRGRAVRLLRFGTEPKYSPDGRRIAFSGGGACGERTGIFSVGANGGRPARLTNDCRIVGGPGTDELRGSQFSDVVLGLGGDDTLTAFDDFYYEGDELDGGAGDDRLIGSIGTDILRGGPGRDDLDGGSAPDVIYSVDGERDVVACGTTRGTSVVERDIAYVDKRDVVRGDCEYVFRRASVQPLPRTWLSIRVWPEGRAGQSRRRVLACAPPRGTLPNRDAACANLARFGDPFASIPPEADCPVRVAEAAVAHVTGYFRKRYVDVWIRRTDGCEIARWNRFRFLFVS